MIDAGNAAAHVAGEAHVARGAKAVHLVRGYLLTFLAKGEETAGSYALVEDFGRKGLSAEPPPHVHGREEEFLYVGEEVILAPAGPLVSPPRGVDHRFEITSEEVRCLNLITPAGFYRQLGEPAPELTLPPAPVGSPDVARIASVAAKYGCEILAPPGQ